jgi:hypothetical protein
MSLVEQMVALLALLWWLSPILAVPSFEGVTNWSSIGSLVPGMTALEAVGPKAFTDNGNAPYYFTVDAPYGELIYALREKLKFTQMYRQRWERNCPARQESDLVLHT